jgi:hypothetical protein
MLATLHRGNWSATKHDKGVTEDAAESHHADIKEAGRYNKQLISRKHLSKVNSKLSVARETHRILTLPWEDDGTRLLSAQGYMHYTQIMRTCRLSVEAAAADFLKNYPEYIKAARLTLGEMFNENDYPSADEVKAKFYLDVEIKPVPEAGDFRTKLADNTVKAIAKDIERRTKDRIEAAVKDVFQRIVDVTGKMSERLNAFEPKHGEKDSSGLFRDSLIYNVSELADLLPSLNITDDPRLDTLSKQLKADLVEHSPDVLRSDAKLRKQTAMKANKIFQKVSTYLA